MPQAELSQEVKNQIAKLREMVYQICYINEATGKIEAKPGTTREQVVAAIRAIKKIESIYNERIVDLDVLNAELDQQDKVVAKTSEKISSFTKRFGEDIFPKWLTGAYKRK